MRRGYQAIFPSAGEQGSDGTSLKWEGLRPPGPHTSRADRRRHGSRLDPTQPLRPQWLPRSDPGRRLSRV